MKRPCGCYVDKDGNVLAKCARCNGSAVRSIQELKLPASKNRAAENERRRLVREQKKRKAIHAGV